MIPAARSHKQPHDTAAGCHAFAEADRVRASAMVMGHGRAKFEHSAATWQARSDMLQRLADSQRARLAAKAA